ncbi:MAG TPA: aldehyde dehydrogenase family protein [Nocardioides sp.]
MSPTAASSTPAPPSTMPPRPFRPVSVAPRHRSDVLRRAHELILRDKDELAALISRENGKSLTDPAGKVGLRR